MLTQHHPTVFIASGSQNKHNAKYDVKVHGVIQSLGEACDLIICNNRCSNIWGTLVIEFSYFGWHIYGETHNLRDETSYLVSRGGFIQIHTF
ncbi:hypothetical protein E1A91_A09G143200v1 [Gossypium mustelinum]|uniref:Uncharacterized protein isoform X2 n=3 Tax=Gossypium TaxID=3633 RepID=A0ABM2YPX2_GOSHI|nr:uncharacterized protein LOC107889453 isoform X2 [Gossypium hirsutum]TYI10687.1 hypothetical protein ES332_A09G158600v1 [Gossypium tomentosum]TYJ18736.1 hypothetical protein E1A91_A09G143200v1 [Gossypium mustelinum]